MLVGVLQLKTCIAQDIHFSQYLANPLNMNPALAGSTNENIKAILSYKDQWNQLDNPYKTYSLSVDGGFLKGKNENGFWGAGLNFFHDISGISKLSTSTINLTGSYHVKLNSNSWLTAGIQGGIIQQKINSGELHWDNQFDGINYNSSLSSGETILSDNFTLGDVSIGLMWNYQSAKVKSQINNEGIKSETGIAFYHVNKPQYSFYNASKDALNIRSVIHSKVSIGLPNSNFAVIPTVVFMRQGSLIEFISGINIRMILDNNSTHTGFLYASAISLGLQYRLKDAISPTFMLEFNHWALGLCYDINISGLKYATRSKGGLEVTLRYSTPNPFTNRKMGNSLL